MSAERGARQASPTRLPLTPSCTPRESLEPPQELRAAITQRGTAKYSNWREASAALATVIVPWKTEDEEFRKREKEFQLSLMGVAPREGLTIAPMVTSGLQQQRNDWGRTAYYHCNGKGHVARQCPSRDEALLRVGETCKRQMHHGRGVTCAVATGPNDIPVSPEWERKLLGARGGPKLKPMAAEASQRSSVERCEVESVGKPRQGTGCIPGNNCNEREVLPKDGCEHRRYVVDSPWWRDVGIRGDPARKVYCVAWVPQHPYEWTWLGTNERFLGDFLVGPVPYDIVLGLDLLTEHKVAWIFQSDKLRTYVNGKWCELPVVRTAAEHAKGSRNTAMRAKSPAEQAYGLLAKKVAGMTSQGDAALLRPEA
ncbi:hypothetical protein EBH_0033280 [Eimeria brunetti]|uniref:CCHC-type domain-containing protein n=1 Tax=Eimeria brunetti TaxID=51314 RepID=U6LJM7_9EIME|nr:hypothetical protein EBH_0033280 [Eimeria brunetti]